MNRHAARRPAARTAAVGAVYAVRAVLVCALAACTPALNWRDTLVGESGVMALFPCKPDQATRTVQLVGKAVGMTLLSCSADGLQFAITSALLPDAVNAAGAATQLRQIAAANLGASAVTPFAATVPGLLPEDHAEGFAVVGTAPSRGAVEQRVVLFTHGATVLEASIFGAHIDGEAADTFFSGLKVPR